MVLPEIVVKPGEFAQVDDDGIVDEQKLEQRQIGAERIGQDEGVAAVVLGSSNSVAVAKAIELFGVVWG